MREARGGGGKGRILYSIPRFIVIIGAPLFGKMGNFLRFLCYWVIFLKVKLML